MCVLCVPNGDRMAERLCAFMELCHHPNCQLKLDSGLCMVRAEVRMSSPVLSSQLQRITPLKGITLGQMLYPTAGIVPSAKPWPQDKGSWKCGGWDLEPWLAVEGLLLLGGCVGGQ